MEEHQSVYQDHLKYIRNDILKPSCVEIIRYTKRAMDMHKLAKYLPPPSMKGRNYEASNWKFRDQEFSVNDILV